MLFVGCWLFVDACSFCVVRCVLCARCYCFGGRCVLLLVCVVACSMCLSTCGFVFCERWLNVVVSCVLCVVCYPLYVGDCTMVMVWCLFVRCCCVVSVVWCLF